MACRATPPRSDRASAHDRAILVLLFVVALAPRLYHVRSPYMNFADHNTANFSIFARNYLDHGWLATRLGQLRNIGSADPGSYVVFAHHPPTIALLTSVAFMALGVSEPAARTLPLVFSAATTGILFLLARRVVGRTWGLLAALLFAFSPGAIYFGQMLDHEAFVVFCGLACLWAWCRHAETESRGWWRACLALMAATIFLDWPGAYLAPAIAAASWLCPATRPRWIRLAAHSGATASAALAIVVGHVLVIKGTLADLAASLSVRVLSTPDRAFTWGEYLDRIDLNLRYALSPAVFWMAVAGAAFSAAAALTGARWRGRRDQGREDRSIAGAPLAVGIGIFGVMHHAIFTDACHFNEHLIYYLLPAICLLAASGPHSFAALLAIRLPRRAAAAAAGIVAAPAIVAFGILAGPQIWSYFNEISAPGWPLMGQALHGIVPEEGILFSTGSLANPQFLHYLWRPLHNDIRDPSLVAGAPEEIVIQDLNAPISPEMDDYLARVPSALALNFAVYRTGRGAPPAIPALAPAGGEWEPVETAFGGALKLNMYRLGPDHLECRAVGLIDRFLGVRWTPELAAGRIVHASFVWERLDRSASDLTPEYEMLLSRNGAEWRAARMWPLPSEVSDLARLEPGAVARHELDWFVGEWIPPGRYSVRVMVRERGRPLYAREPGGPAGPAAQLILRDVQVIF